MYLDSGNVQKQHKVHLNLWIIYQQLQNVTKKKMQANQNALNYIKCNKMKQICVEWSKCLKHIPTYTKCERNTKI